MEANMKVGMKKEQKSLTRSWLAGISLKPGEDLSTLNCDSSGSFCVTTKTSTRRQCNLLLDNNSNAEVI